MFNMFSICTLSVPIIQGAGKEPDHLSKFLMNLYINIIPLQNIYYSICMVLWEMTMFHSILKRGKGGQLSSL